MAEIRTALEKGLDVSLYATPEFDWLQMAEIRFGLEKGLDVSIYLNPGIDYEEMEKGSIIVKDNKNKNAFLSLKQYMHPRVRTIMFNDTLWEVAKEPRYRVAFYNGFGSYHLPLIMVDSDGPFNANQFDLAVDYALKQSKR